MSDVRDMLYLRIEAERLKQDKKGGGRPGIDRFDNNYPAVIGEVFGDVCAAALEGRPAEAIAELIRVTAVAISWAEQITETGKV
jgi:hypothetical protein